jgi:hypothetical protein
MWLQFRLVCFIFKLLQFVWSDFLFTVNTWWEDEGAVDGTRGGALAEAVDGVERGPMEVVDIRGVASPFLLEGGIATGNLNNKKSSLNSQPIFCKCAGGSLPQSHPLFRFLIKTLY